MGQTIKILVFTPQYAPDFGPSAPIYTALCEDLTLMGCDVTVVTGFPNYAGSGDWFPSSKKQFFEEERINGVRVMRIYVYKMPKSALWRRLIYHGSYNLFSTLAALRVREPDVLLADAPTLWSGLPLMVKSILPGVPFVYVVHDIYPDVLFRLGVLNNPKIIHLIERIEHYYYDRSAKVSVLSEGFKENLLRKGVPEEKIVIIPACVDVDFVQPLPKESELLKRWDLEGKFVVLYAGNMGLSQGLDTILESAKLLRAYQDIAFVFVGEGASKPSLQAMAAEYNLKNVVFFPFQPRQEVPCIYALADVSLVSLKKDIVVESVPSKTYTIMASGRPIVATVDPATEVGHLLSQAQCGICVEPDNPSALIDAILTLYRDATLRRIMGINARDFVVAHYSRQVAAHQYYDTIQHFDRDGHT